MLSVYKQDERGNSAGEGCKDLLQYAQAGWTLGQLSEQPNQSHLCAYSAQCFYLLCRAFSLLPGRICLPLVLRRLQCDGLRSAISQTQRLPAESAHNLFGKLLWRYALRVHGESDPISRDVPDRHILWPFCQSALHLIHRPQDLGQSLTCPHLH